MLWWIALQGFLFNGKIKLLINSTCKIGSHNQVQNQIIHHNIFQNRLA
jgi:hypothetical protein